MMAMLRTSLPAIWGARCTRTRAAAQGPSRAECFREGLETAPRPPARVDKPRRGERNWAADGRAGREPGATRPALSFRGALGEYAGHAPVRGWAPARGEGFGAGGAS